MKIIGETIVGSHIWKMNHKDSDIDIFQIYVEPTKNILNGTAKKKSYFKQIDNTDYAIHEAEKVVNMLLTGNINFIVGVLSPEPNKVTPEFLELKEITHNNLAKNCYHSIRGMSIHNQMKYEEKGLMTEKKWNQLIRSLDFGIRILNRKGVKFEPVTSGIKELFEEKLVALDLAYELSKLPEKPDEKPFREWLYDLRIKEMERRNMKFNYQQLEKLVSEIRKSKKKKLAKQKDDFVFCHTCGCYHYKNCHIHEKINDDHETKE